MIQNQAMIQMKPKRKIIDTAEYPKFWLPKYWALKNAVEGIDASLAHINIQKYGTGIPEILKNLRR